MKRLILIVVAALFVPAVAQAQTAAFTWEYPVPLATVQGYAQVPRVDTTTITATPTCVATSPTLTTCSVPITPLATGTHTLSVAATANGITAQTTLTGLNPSSTTAPQNPANFKYQINVTVNVGP